MVCEIGRGGNQGMEKVQIEIEILQQVCEENLARAGNAKLDGLARLLLDLYISRTGSE